MQAFYLKQCKVPNYAQNYALKCTCGDQPHRIPSNRRNEKFDEGALWCSGSMLLPLVTGTQGVIYNPFTMEQLTALLTPTVEVCMDARAKEVGVPTACSMQEEARGGLSVLIDQQVQPIDVWARCKSNYLYGQWDVGAGAVFMDSNAMDTVTGVSDYTKEMQPVAVQWATDHGLLSCMRAQGRFDVDYGTCMTAFLQTKYAHTPAWYYTYDIAPEGQLPDACLVFSGLAKNAPPELATKMQGCLNVTRLSVFEQEQTKASNQCDLNPLLWRSGAPHVASVTQQHGSASASTADIAQEYAALRQRALYYFAEFNRTWEAEKKLIETAFFSVDGDMVHDFLDCVFLGPYTRADWLPCLTDDNDNCLFYARDDSGGMHRNFSTRCLRDDTNPDFNPPFTCGSKTRRSLIKYFFRNVTHLADENTLNENVTAMLFRLVMQLQANYTDVQAYGCMDATTGLCTPEACFVTIGNYWPCLSNLRAVTSKVVEEFFAQSILPQVVPSLFFTCLHFWLCLAGFLNDFWLNDRWKHFMRMPCKIWAF